MLFTGKPTPHSGTWIELDDAAQLSYKLQGTFDGPYLDLRFLGQAELELSMSRATAARCHDLFGRALAEIEAGAAATEDDELPCEN